MAQWFNRLFFLILPDFLPKVILNIIIIFILIGKPKLLKKIHAKSSNGVFFHNGYLLLYILLIIILIASMWFGFINTLLIIVNMIPGIAI